MGRGVLAGNSALGLGTDVGAVLGVTTLHASGEGSSEGEDDGAMDSEDSGDDEEGDGDGGADGPPDRSTAEHGSKPGIAHIHIAST